MTVKEMIELLKLMPEDNIVMAEFSEFREHGSVEDVLLGSGTLKGFCFVRLEADEWRFELDCIKKDIMRKRVKLDDVLELVNRLNDNGGFKDYSDYSNLFDDVASLSKI